MTRAYGEKRNYKKINIYLRRPGGASTYLASTTWARSCREAVLKYCEKNPGKYAASDLHAHYEH